MNEQQEKRTPPPRRREGWIAVDLDGTIAVYETWRGEAHVGEPTPLVKDVRRWLEAGWEVKILTARVSLAHDQRERAVARGAIRTWCRTHLGRELDIVSDKDKNMLVLFDDRAVGVERNKGRVLAHCSRLDGLMKDLFP